jgi:hypothetical protein
MSDKWFWILVAGVIGGFAFAAGSSLEAKTEAKIKSRQSTAGADVVGARTENTPGVY